MRLIIFEDLMSTMPLFRCLIFCFFGVHFIYNYSRVDLLRKEVNIALVGKYTKLEDSYASVLKALQHAAIEVGYKLNVTVSVSVKFFSVQ